MIKINGLAMENLLRESHALRMDAMNIRKTGGNRLNNNHISRKLPFYIHVQLACLVDASIFFLFIFHFK